MNSTLLKASIALVPVSALVAYSATAFVKLRTVPTLLQLIGAACLVLVVLTHVAEGLHLFPAMGWGEPSRVGHYLDLSSAALGVTLTPLGYIRQGARRGE